MGHYAFVGESAPAPVQQPGLGARVLRGAGVVAALLAFFVVTAGGMVLGGFTTPFHYVDALVVVAVAIVPALLVLASFGMRDGGMLLAFTSGRPMKTVNALAGTAFFLAIVPGNLVLYANERLDGSPAVVETVPVTETWIRTGRHDRRTYLAGVTTQVTSPLGGWSLYGSQPIAVGRDAWQRIVPGRTSFVLREHRGFFRLPWFEPHPAQVN